MKELAKEHICTKNSVVIARGKGPGGSLEAGRGGGKGDIGNSVNNKNKEKNNKGKPGSQPSFPSVSNILAFLLMGLIQERGEF